MNQEATHDISIKGIRDGLLITVSNLPPYEEVLQTLTAEVEAKRSFLRGSRVVLEVGGRILTHEQLTYLQELFAQNGMALWAVLSKREATREATRDLGLATRLPGSTMDLQGNGRPEPAEPVGQHQHPSIPPNALLIKETLRSGRAIYYEGHIIIMGDVNPGAEVVADGDIIVWGKLRGLVHAGALGDTQARVCALDLSPTQLRIADQIAITPSNRRHTPMPEMALIRDDQIIAEAWK
ncbi:MAG: septum site-determining protein MinC [Anaerolineales bacterium]|nr:septum site-determining protein MinC [Anaerolineales bacterium]